MKSLSVAVLMSACLLTHTGALLAQSATNQPPQPKVLFYLNFQSGFAAKDGTTPTNTNLPKLVDGLTGKAALFTKGTVLRYPAAGHLNKSEGTLSMWVQSPVNGVDSQELKLTAFREDGPAKGKDTNSMWLWFHGSVALRGDVRDPKDRYLYFAPTSRWKKGEWHLVTFLWNRQKGTTAYVDGRFVGNSTLTSWTPKPYPTFFIGASTAQGEESWSAAIGEVTIFDRQLTENQVREQYQKYAQFTCQITPHATYLTADRPGFARVDFFNPTDRSETLGDIRYQLTRGGKNILEGKLPSQTLGTQESSSTKISLSVTEPGDYLLNLSARDSQGTRSVSTPVWVYPSAQAPLADASAQTEVCEIDIATQKPLAESEASTVVSSPLGAYREAGAQRHSRFMVEFAVKELNKPHIAVITYPDDKPRTMEFLLHDLSGKSDYQAQSGVFTGDEYPVTGKMKEARILFWPRSTRLGFAFMTLEAGRPAAVKSLKVYKLDRLEPKPQSGVFSGSVPAREIGLYYEDPVLNQSFGEKTTLEGFSNSLDKLTDYMQSFGQVTLNYPVVWYEGPLYGSAIERFTGQLGGRRPHPDNYPALYLAKLRSRGMTFNAGLHIHKLLGLTAFAITDRARVDQGEETVLNVRNDGSIWPGEFHGKDPGFNPIDPRVEQAVTALADEIADLYGDDPAFTGVTLVIARPKLFSFGSIESGYNDRNLQKFQKDTGISIVAYQPSSPQRFSETYRWLRNNPTAWKAWVDWRCVQLHDHYKRLAARIAAHRPGLKLTLNLFTPLAFYPRMADYLQANPLEVWREMGIDPSLYANEPNIILSYTLVPADYRMQRRNSKPDSEAIVSRTVYTAPECLEFMRQMPQPEALIHDRYWEDAVGRTEPLKGLPVPEYGWRVATVNASGYYALEPYVTALNAFDSQRITRGGFLLGTLGIEDELSAFSAAYRALPAVKFDDVPGANDPVRVRQKVVDGKLYFYVLNRLPEPATVQLSFKQGGKLTQPVTNATLNAPSELSLNLKPYELLVFQAEPSQTLTGAKSSLPAEISAQLDRALEQARSRVSKFKTTRPADYRAAEPYLALAEKCKTSGAYARLYFLLQERWARIGLQE